MNTTDDVPNRADEEASLWAAKLDGGDLGPAEQAELEAWLAAGPDRRELLGSYCDVSVDLDQLLPELARSGRLERPASGRPSGRRTLGWLAAGAACAAALAAAFLWMGLPGARPETISAPVAQRRAFTLADGSRVELNANTSLLVENGKSERRVKLADGEAFFQVSKDKERPFIVETPAGSVRVTGTRFDVKTSATSELVVTVEEGSVQVRPGDPVVAKTSEPVLLGPGDSLSVAGSGVSLKGLSADALEDALAWRDGKIVCVAMPVSELLAQVSRFHGRAITATAGASVRRINARMSLDDLDQFFKDLEQADSKLQVSFGADGVARVRLRSED